MTRAALVTGSSMGIGAATVEYLLDLDFKIYGVSRTEPAIEHEQFRWIPCDLSNNTEVEAVAAKIDEAKLDLFVSNAGVATTTPASRITVAAFHETFSVNLVAPMLLISTIRAQLATATIISISSDGDRFPDGDFALYCSSKAANTLFFDSLALDLKTARVFTLLPDYVETPMLHALYDNDNAFEWQDTMSANDIAQLVAQLADKRLNPPSGSNIIVANNALKGAFRNAELLFGWNTDTKELSRLV